VSAQTKTAESTVVNGSLSTTLFALIDGVKREPAKGKTNWHVTTTWQGPGAEAAPKSRVMQIGGGKGTTPVLDRHRASPMNSADRTDFANPQDHLIAEPQRPA